MDSQNLSNRKINILYWNARSINKHKEELENHLQQVDIFICVESWLKEKDKINFKGFNCVQKDRPENSDGGILILIGTS